MISQNTSYSCNECKDTTWVTGDAGLIRCKCFSKEQLERRWKKFGVNPNDIKKINDYEADTEGKKIAKNKAANFIINFDKIKKERNNSIAFLGQPGAGKTHLALGIGKALLERKNHVSVAYMPYLEVIKELKMNATEETAYNSIQNRYISSEVLIIDDLFKDKVKRGKLTGELTEADMKHIYPIINQRYINHKPTIYSSECNASMLMDLDEALAGRILESCKDNLVIFKYCKENNYRLRNL